MTATFQQGLDLISKHLKNSVYISQKQVVLHSLESSFLSTAHPIVTTGIGKSGNIAKKLAISLTSLGFNARFIHPVEALHGDLGSLHYTSIVFAFSNSGTTEEVLKLTDYIEDNYCAQQFMITSGEYLPREYFDPIQYPHFDEPFNVPTLSTTAAMICVDDLIYKFLQTKEIGNRILENFELNHPGGSIGENYKGTTLWT